MIDPREPYLTSEHDDELLKLGEDIKMNTYYVTFSMVTVFRHYYVVFEAVSEEILKAYLDKHYPKLWVSAYSTPKALIKSGMVRLNADPEILFYTSKEGV